jgi:hypothetical protein
LIVGVIQADYLRVPSARLVAVVVMVKRLHLPFCFSSPFLLHVHTSSSLLLLLLLNAQAQLSLA